MRQVQFWALGLIVVVAEAGFAGPKYDEWVYRDGAVERAESVCGNPESQTQAPKFKAAAGAELAVKNVLTDTIIIGSEAPLTSIGKTRVAGTFWQLDNQKFEKGNDEYMSAYVYFECGGEKYFAFNVFVKGSLTPIMRVGVPQDDTSIFKSAQIANDTLAGFLIDAKGFQSALVQAGFTEANRPLLQTQDPAPAPTPAPVPVQNKPAQLSKIALIPVNQVPLPRPRPHIGPQPKATPTAKPASTPKASDTGADTDPNTDTSPDTSSDMTSINKAAVWYGKIYKSAKTHKMVKITESMSLEWTKTVIEIAREQWAELSKAKDVGDFCPGYAKATRQQQEICWLRVIGGVVQFESGFAPDSSFREANGTYSVGLMAMSVGQCPGIAGTMVALEQAVSNLKCGVTNFAKWTAEAGSISNLKGAARNWSTLRNPYTVEIGGRPVTVGKKRQVESIAMLFKKY